MKKKLISLLIFVILFISSCSLFSNNTNDDSILVNPLPTMTIDEFGRSKKLIDSNFTLFWELEEQGLGTDGKIHLMGYLIPAKDITIDLAVVTDVPLTGGNFIVDWETTEVTKELKSFTCVGDSYGWEIGDKLVWCNISISDNTTYDYTIRQVVTEENYFHLPTKTIYWNKTKTEIIKHTKEFKGDIRYTNIDLGYGNDTHYITDMNVKKDIKYEMEIILEVDKRNLPFKYTVALGDISENKLWFLYDPTIVDSRTWTTTADFTNGTITNMDTSGNEFKGSSAFDTTNLTIWLTFDDTNTSGSTRYDVSGNSLDATCSGTVPGDVGMINESEYFDSSGQCIISDNSLMDIEQFFTFGLWFNTTVEGGSPQYFRNRATDGSPNVEFLHQANNNRFLFITQNDDGDMCMVNVADGAYNDGEFHYLILIFNDTNTGSCATECLKNVHVLIDGIKPSQSILASAGDCLATGGFDFQTGMYIGDQLEGGRPMIGNIDEFFQINRELEKPEYDYLYASGSPDKDQHPTFPLGDGFLHDLQSQCPQADNLITNISVEQTKDSTGMTFSYSDDNSTFTEILLTTDGTNDIDLSGTFTVDECIYYKFNSSDASVITSYTISEKLGAEPALDNVTIFDERWNTTSVSQGDSVKGLANVTSNETIDSVVFEIEYPNATRVNYTGYAEQGGSAIINATDKTCSYVWGEDCGTTCTTESDNTYDDCLNCHATDERINEIYLNASEIFATDKIKVTCEYHTTETTNDFISVVYRNSTTANWEVVCSGASSGTSGTIRNFTACDITTDNVIGEHQVRCNIKFSDAAATCQSGTFLDNDDANFIVIAATTELDSYHFNLTDTQQTGIYNMTNVYANTTTGASNFTSPNLNFTISAADSCSCPGSGDWRVDCTDNCIITENCDLGTDSLYLDGEGIFKIEAIIDTENVLKDVEHLCTIAVETSSGELNIN